MSREGRRQLAKGRQSNQCRGLTTNSVTQLNQDLLISTEIGVKSQAKLSITLSNFYLYHFNNFPAHDRPTTLKKVIRNKF